MFELTVQTVGEYLAARGVAVGGLRVTELGGGVSNTVLLCEFAGGERAVLKQSLGRLRVAEEWLADRRRIEREWRAIEVAGTLMPPGCVPRVLWTDRANGVYAMTAAPESWRTWKELLFAGAPSPDTARQAAGMLAAWIGESSGRADLRAEFGDKTAFDQLRLDPYYRFTAARHPELRAWFDSLVARTLAAEHALVHGDWSPKNILVGEGSAMAIDFEVAHFGEPAFDVAFLLNHLLLKSIHLGGGGAAAIDAAHEFWREFQLQAGEAARRLEAEALLHLPALMLARVDGKSPAEYLRAGEREFARSRALEWIAAPPSSLDRAIEIAAKWRLA